MRLFLAVDVDDGTRAAAGAAIDRLRRTLSSGKDRDVKWVPPENLHLTLHFLGEVQEGRAEMLRVAQQTPLDQPPFDLRFGTVGTFPPTGSTRVIWIDIVSGNDMLARVYDELGARLRGLGFETEVRPFRAHLTVGRFRVPARAEVRRALLDTRIADVGACRVDHVTLYQSRLSPRGPTYIALERTALRAERA
jgi:2'-5' RNA ligase